MEQSSDYSKSAATRCWTLTQVGLIGLLGLGTDATSEVRSGQTGISGNPLQTFGSAVQ